MELAVLQNIHHCSTIRAKSEHVTVQPQLVHFLPFVYENLSEILQCKKIETWQITCNNGVKRSSVRQGIPKVLQSDL